MPRRPSIFLSTDGLYHCFVTVGKLPNGKPKRKNVSGRTETIVSEKVAEIERTRDSGAEIVSKAPTLAEWLDYYLESVVRATRAPKTYDAYHPIVHLHLKPRIGGYRIAGTRNVLTPDHVEACYTDLKKALAPSYVLQCHRVLSRALKVAVRRGRATRNVCTLIDGPSVRRRRPKPLTAANLAKVNGVIEGDRLYARWLIALLMGLRQGEVLGLHWSWIDFDDENPSVQLATQAQRHKWQHGCKDRRACAKRRCRTEPCRPRSGVCKTHKRPASCTKLCPPNCVGHAAACPERVGGGIVDVDLKSEKSERPVPLPKLVVKALRTHRAKQAEEKLAHDGAWPHPDLVFLTPEGQRIDPTRDHEAWEAILVRAGVPDAPLHAARHTAATRMIVTGSNMATVQEIMGHSDIRTTRGYTDVAEAMKREALERAAEALVLQPAATAGASRRSSRPRKPR